MVLSMALKLGFVLAFGPPAVAVLVFEHRMLLQPLRGPASGYPIGRTNGAR